MNSFTLSVQSILNICSSGMAFSQSSVMDDQVSFPIVKFSYATTAAGRSQPLGWSHVSSAGDLRAVFETASTAQGTQKVLRVVRETEILVS